jgi:hypothetical protein
MVGSPETFDEVNAFATMQQGFAELRAGGTALASHYEVMVFPPANHPATQDEKRSISMRCESVAMPGMNLASSPDVNMYAVQQEVVDGVTFSGSTNMVFTASQNFSERKFFEQWQGLAWKRNSWNIGYYDDYVGSAEIYLLDRSHKKVFGVKLFDVFPKEINGTDLSYAPASGAGLKLTVQMQYKYWDALSIERQIGTNVSSAQEAARRNRERIQTDEAVKAGKSGFTSVFS